MCLLPSIASASTKTERDWEQALDEEIAGLAQRFKEEFQFTYLILSWMCGTGTAFRANLHCLR